MNIVRLEVVSREHDDVWDDIELMSDTEGQLDAVTAALRDRGLNVIGLPRAWTIRDWAVEVLHSLETLGGCPDESSAIYQFASTAAELVNAVLAFVLFEPIRPDARAAETRWTLIRAAAERFDPGFVNWSGESRGTRIVSSAMKAARGETAATIEQLSGVVGAVIPIPMPARRPGHLAVIGQRPPFLTPELRRLELYADVAAPHLQRAGLETSA